SPVRPLPPIFTYWASRFLAPRLKKVMGSAEPDAIFAMHIADRLVQKNAGNRILSIAAGSCESEIRIARMLQGRELDFRFKCLAVTSGGKRSVDEAGLAD